MTSTLITTRAAAGLLGVGTTSIKRWADDGTLPCVRTAGGHRRFLRSDVLGLLHQGRADEPRASLPPTATITVDQLGQMSREQLDGVPFGVIGLDDQGVVVAYNRSEERFAGLRRADVLGRSFFTDVAPCTNNRLLRARFEQGVASGVLDVKLDYTFTYRMDPRLVQLHLVRDNAGNNWLLVHPR